MDNKQIVDLWNNQHGVGTHVIASRAGAGKLRTTTQSAAFIDPERGAMIRLAGLAGAYPLESLQVAEVRTNQRAGTK